MSWLTGALRLTGAARNLVGSVFTTTPVNVAAFHTAFDFKLTTAQADGFAFVIQGIGPKAKGQAGMACPFGCQLVRLVMVRSRRRGAPMGAPCWGSGILP